MVDLEDKIDDIVKIYINRLYHTDKTVGVIVNKEIAEYVLDNLIRLDETSIKEIDLVDYMNIDEYLVSVDDNGVITVVPIEDFCVLDKTDVFYIDMDGDISQDIIDYCVNENKEVILFGQEDDCECDRENCNCHDETYLHTSEDEDENTHGFTAVIPSVSCNRRSRLSGECSIKRLSASWMKHICWKRKHWKNFVSCSITDLIP